MWVLVRHPLFCLFAAGCLIPPVFSLSVGRVPRTTDDKSTSSSDHQGQITGLLGRSAALWKGSRYFTAMRIDRKSAKGLSENK